VEIVIDHQTYGTLRIIYRFFAFTLSPYQPLSTPISGYRLMSIWAASDPAGWVFKSGAQDGQLKFSHEHIHAGITGCTENMDGAVYDLPCPGRSADGIESGEIFVRCHQRRPAWGKIDITVLSGQNQWLHSGLLTCGG
jgi:hypothetical protein